jgi:hypothetical protein
MPAPGALQIKKLAARLRFDWTNKSLRSQRENESARFFAHVRIAFQARILLSSFVQGLPKQILIGQLLQVVKTLDSALVSSKARHRYLILPEPLKADKGQSVIGINYALLDDASP